MLKRCAVSLNSLAELVIWDGQRIIPVLRQYRNRPMDDIAISVARLKKVP